MKWWIGHLIHLSFMKSNTTIYWWGLFSVITKILILIHPSQTLCHPSGALISFSFNQHAVKKDNLTTYTRCWSFKFIFLVPLFKYYFYVSWPPNFGIAVTVKSVWASIFNTFTPVTNKLVVLLKWEWIVFLIEYKLVSIYGNRTPVCRSDS